MPPLHDVMTREVEVLSPNATVAEAAVRMAKLDMGSIPICEGTRLAEMLTDRDLVVRVMAPGCEPKSLTPNGRETSCQEEINQSIQGSKKGRPPRSRKVIGERVFPKTRPSAGHGRP